jgi:hypothetical protein
MEINFNCPKCGEVTLIGEEFVGQSGECRTCGAWITVSNERGGGRGQSLCAAREERFSAYGIAQALWMVLVRVLWTAVCYPILIVAGNPAAWQMNPLFAAGEGSGSTPGGSKQKSIADSVSRSERGSADWLRRAVASVRNLKSGAVFNVVFALLVIVFFAYLIAPELYGNRTRVRRRPPMASQLKMIALAMHNYHDTYGHFPRAAWIDEQGRSHSWRVQLLPFLEQEAAYDYFRNAPPTNHAKTRQWRREAASLFRDPDDKKSPREQTSIMVITGPGTMFEDGRDLSLKDCLDGSSNTILAVEVRNSGSNWDAPVDLDIRSMVFRLSTGDQFGLGNVKGTGAHVAMVDGSVRFLTNDQIASTLREMITRAGGATIADSGEY